MILHRLRLLSFSKSVFSIKTPNLSNIKEAENDKVTQENTEAVPKVDSSTVVESKKKHENTTKFMKPCTDFVVNQADLKTREIKDCLKLKSESEIYKNLPKRKKSRTDRKTYSLGDLIKRFSQKNLEYSNRIKQTFQALRKQKAGKRSKKKSNEAQQKNVPFAESPSKYQKCRQSSKRQTRPHLCRSSNIFGFCRNTRLIDPYTHYQRYSKFDPIQALIERSAKKRKKLDKVHTNCPYNHYPLKVVTSSNSWGSKPDGRNCTNPLHYNLVNFPQGSKSLINKKHSSRLHRQEAMPECVGGDPKLAPARSPSKVPVPSHSSPLKAPGTSVDKAVMCDCEKKANTPLENRSKVCTQKPKCSMSKQKNEPCKRMVPISMIYSKIYRKILHRNSSRSIVKYILLGLVCIAWSPMIIVIGIGWILTFPLRPRHVISANNRQNYKCREDLNHNKISAMGLTRRIAKPMYTAGCAIISLIRSKKHCEPEDTLKCSAHPDPKRKYTLFHASGRGWVLKPVRGTKPGTEPQKHNNFIQNMHNLFCDCDHNIDHQTTSTRTNIETKPTINAIDNTQNHHLHRPTKDPCSGCASKRHVALRRQSRKKEDTDKVEKRDIACQSPRLVCGKLKKSAAQSDVQQRSSNFSSPIPPCLIKGISNLNCLKEFYSKKQQPFSCRSLKSKRSRSETNLHHPDPELVSQKSVRSSSVSKAKETSDKVSTRGRLTKLGHAEPPANIEDNSILSKSGDPELVHPKSVRIQSESKAKESSTKVNTRGRFSKSGNEERPEMTENRASILRKSGDPELVQPKSVLSPSEFKANKSSAKVTKHRRSTKLENSEVHANIEDRASILGREDPELVQPKSILSQSKSKAKKSSVKVTKPGLSTDLEHSEVHENFEDRASMLGQLKSKDKKSSVKVTKRGQSTKLEQSEVHGNIEDRASILSQSDDPELVQPKSMFGQSKSKAQKSSAKATKRGRSTKLENSEVHENIEDRVSIDIAGNINQHNQKTRRKTDIKIKKNKTRRIEISKQSRSGTHKQVLKHGKKIRMGQRPLRNNTLCKCPKKQKRTSCIRKFWERLKSSVCTYLDPMDDPEREYCPFNLNCVCRDLYLVTLRVRPWFWVYRCCPSKYPMFLKLYYCSKQFFYHLMTCFSLCFWTPIICMCYFCYKLVSCFC